MLAGKTTLLECPLLDLAPGCFGHFSMARQPATVGQERSFLTVRSGCISVHCYGCTSSETKTSSAYLDDDFSEGTFGQVLIGLTSLFKRIYRVDNRPNSVLAQELIHAVE